MTKDQTPETKIEEEVAASSLHVDNDDGIPVIEGEVVEKTAGEEEPEEKVDELLELRQELEAAQTQAEEYLDDLRRERAAFQNYKKRQENERKEIRLAAQANLLAQILPILDDMGRALEAVPENQADQSWMEGMQLIQRKLEKTLENNGVTPVEVEPGQSFDPQVHEAMSYEAHEVYEEGEIIAVVHKGYKLGERVLRPAMVRVAQ